MSDYRARFPLSEHIFHTNFGGDGEFFENTAKGYFPDNLRRAYKYDTRFTGKGIKIAVISALGNVAMEQNMRVFCERFSLQKPKMSFFYPDGEPDTYSREWLIESSLDTQWSHVFAPEAEILVVFSRDASVSGLLSCTRYAMEELTADVVCMCFGSVESASDEEMTSFMKQRGIFVASAGDVGGQVSFPSTSPFCISVGASNLRLSESGNRVSETAWTFGGGGRSRIFDIPFYQGRFFNIYGMTDGKRGTPDVSMMANYSPGVPVYISQLGGWTTVGGTSLSTACFAGICACIKQRYPEIEKSEQMLSFLYNKAGGDGYEFPQYNFFDITVGKSGDNFAKKGWDFATGLGSPVINLILQ